MSTPQAEVFDLTAARGRRALAVITARSEDIEANRLAIIDAWRDYGGALLELRERNPRARDFGAAVREAGLDAPPAASGSTRSDAMWLARLSESMFATVRKHATNYTNPVLLRKYFRLQFPDADTGEDGRRVGVHGSLRKFLHDEGLAPARPCGAAMREAVRRLAEYMGVLPSEVPRTPTAEELAHMRDAVSRARAVPPSAEIMTLAEQVEPARRQEFATLLAEAKRAQFEQLRAQFEQQVRKQVTARTADKQEKLDAYEHELDERAVRIQARLATIVPIMSYKEFCIVRSCLHSDHVKDAYAEKATRAYQIFSRLEATADANAPIETLRKCGWEHLKPHRRPS